jgi:arsenate reductase
MKKKVLFLCTHNSARSQIAEAILNSQKTNLIAYSAGIKPAKEIHPMAIKTMANLNINIRDQKPKSVDDFIDVDFDFVITLCREGREECPKFKGMPTYAHWWLPDPEQFAGTDETNILYFEELVKDLNDYINLFISVAND